MWLGEYQVTHSPGPREGLPRGWEGAMWGRYPHKTMLGSLSTPSPANYVSLLHRKGSGGDFKRSRGHEENSREVPGNYKMACLASLLGRLVGPLPTDGAQTGGGPRGPPPTQRPPILWLVQLTLPQAAIECWQTQLHLLSPHSHPQAGFPEPSCRQTAAATPRKEHSEEKATGLAQESIPDSVL